MATSAEYRRAARQAARRFGLPFFPRQIRAESGFQDVRSPAGAQGPAQLMPATARSLGVDPHSPEAIFAAAKLMRSYVNRYGNVEDALRAYNAGPGAVQRSRGYRETNDYVRRILHGGGGGASPRAGAAPSSSGGFVPGVQGAQGVPEGSQGLLTLLQALDAKPQPPAGGIPAAPAHTARAALPQGYQPPESGGGPAPKPDVGALLEQVRTVGGSVESAPGNAGGVMPAMPGMSVSARGGRVVLDPNADRPGVPTRPDVLAFAREVSAIAGRPVRIGTGSRHSRLTVNGNVSDHWNGEAGDIPATGRRLIALGRAALIAAGMPAAEARRQTGGLYNVNGAQIIFNTQEGGDHTDHLHIRPPRRRR